MTDESTPRSALDTAGRAIRSFNHLSSTRFSADSVGWTDVSDAYDATAELAYLAAMLPQVVDHILGSVAAAASSGHVGVDGSQSTQDADRVVRAVGAALTRAGRAAHVLADEARAAQNELSVVHELRPVQSRHGHEHTDRTAWRSATVAAVGSAPTLESDA